MAEFCPDCWNKLNGTDDAQFKYELSEDLELCEGCGEWKRVIVGERGSGCAKWLWIALLAFLVLLIVAFVKTAIHGGF